MKKDYKLVEKRKPKPAQHVVLTGLLYSSKDQKSINDFLKEKGWGKVKFVLQFKTLPGFGGEGGRNDVVFSWHGTQKELGKFSVQRFGMGANMPRWLEDYIDNNHSIIPGNILNELKKLTMW